MRGGAGVRVVGAFLLLILCLGPLGCATLVGYGIGSRIDDRRRAELPAPYAESLPAAVGRAVHLTDVSGHVFSGRLLAVETGDSGEPLCLIDTVRPVVLPGDPSRVDTVAVSAIRSARAARDRHAYREAGVFLGLLTDATAVCVVFAALRSVGGGASK